MKLSLSLSAFRSFQQVRSTGLESQVKLTEFNCFTLYIRMRQYFILILLEKEDQIKLKLFSQFDDIPKRSTIFVCLMWI